MSNLYGLLYNLVYVLLDKNFIKASYHLIGGNFYYCGGIYYFADVVKVARHILHLYAIISRGQKVKNASESTRQN